MVAGCITLILNENLLDTDQNFPRLDTPTFPREFPQSVIKLVGRYILSLKVKVENSLFSQKKMFVTTLIKKGTLRRSTRTVTARAHEI